MFGLDEQTLELITGCLRQFPEINWVKIYGSRAKGDYQRGSDIDLAFSSPTPYMFDATHFETLRHEGLKEHIERVGVCFYRKDGGEVQA
jgi:predicted nucleotidyltransferase